MASPPPRPQSFGLERPSFGFGDRLGLATPGHLAAARRFPFTPVFAQQSVRELDRTRRTFADVLTAAQTALAAAGFKGAWGAEADLLKTDTDITRAAAAGFTRFTVDASSFIENRADRLDARALAEGVANLVRDGLLDRAWTTRYLDRAELAPTEPPLRVEAESLSRAAVKFAAAVAHARRLARALATGVPRESAAIELDLRGAATATTWVEHLFVASELRHAGVAVAAIAPRWPDEFEAAVDYRGDARAFEESLRGHAAIARRLGPYAISVPGGSDKLSLLPVFGRVCGDALHVKTAGASWLEALRVVCRAAPVLFQEIVMVARQHFDAERAFHRVGTTTAEVERLCKAARRASLEHAFLEERPGRQLLHAASGAVLAAGRTSRGRPMIDAIREVVAGESALYHGLLDAYFTRHLALLNRG